MLITTHGNKTYSFLNGGGEMGELIRNLDWAKTPLGDVNSWPQSLKTSISIMLETHFPMYIAWGPEYTQFYNDQYRPILGLTKHPAIGAGSQNTFSEIWDIIGPMFEGVVQGNAVGVTDFFLPLDRYGYTEECYFIFSYSPIRDESGGVGGILVIVTETSERVIGERRLRTLRRMANGASQTKSIENASIMALDILNENKFDIPYSAIYLLSENGKEALLVKNSFVPGNDSSFASIDLTSEIQEGWPLHEVLRNRKAIILRNTAKIYSSFPGGEWPECSSSAYLIPLIRPEKEHPYGILILGISARKTFDENYKAFFELIADHIATALTNASAYESERKRVESLLEIDKLKTAFFSNISHEFRTPLTLILGPLEELLSDNELKLPPVHKENIQAIHRNAKRLLKLVNNLLDFSRIEAGRINPSYEPVQFVEFTKDIASSFRTIIEKAGLYFEIEEDQFNEPVYLDKEMWEKIILNLLSNAFKFTLNGGVTLSLTHDKEYAILVVADTGVGIPASELPKMFQRFHRSASPKSRSYEGSGIGLSLVSELVKLNFGVISVSSTENIGSRFTVKIPLGRGHLPFKQEIVGQNNFGSSVSVEEYVNSSVPYKKFNSDHWSESNSGDNPVVDQITNNSESINKQTRILIVDDNQDMRSYLKRLLDPYFIVSTASNGQEALQSIYLSSPELVISDIMMPVMDGKELIRRMKSDPNMSQVPVIFLSARAGEEARIDGLDSGADDYLVKPFSGKELLSKIRSQIKIAGIRNHASRQLRNLFLQAPVAIAILKGPDFVVELANEMMLRLCDQTTHHILNKPVIDSIPKLKDLGLDKILEKVYCTGERYVNAEYSINSIRNGIHSQIFLKFEFEPIREVNNSISGIMVLAQEITEMVLSRKNLEDSESRFRMIADTAPVLIWMSDSSKLCYFVNKESLKFTGRRFEDELGFGWTEMIHEDDRARCFGIYSKAFDLRQEYEMEFRLLRHDGVYRWMSEKGIPRFDNSGKFEGYIGSCMEIHQMKEHEAQKDDFIKMASHELKTPITSIKGYVQLLLQVVNDEPNELLKNSLITIDKQITKLTKLITDLLDLTKIESGGFQMNKEIFNFNALTREIIQDLQQITLKHKIILLENEEFYIEADRNRISQVIINLVTNAIKYSPRADKIYVEVSAIGKEVFFKVQDFGIGIPKEDHSKIFERFYRVQGRDEKTFPGFGIGLFIANDIVNAHHGRMWVESEKGKGSIFYFSLPSYF